MNSELASAFLDDRSPATRTAYERILRNFSTFLGSQDIEAAAERLLSAGSEKAVQIATDYRSWLVDRGLSSATINQRLAAVRGLAEHAKTCGVISWSLPSLNLKLVPRHKAPEVSESGFRKMIKLAEARTDPKGIRDLAILRLLHDAALSSGEIAKLDLQDVDLSNRTASVTGWGGAQVVMPLPKSTVDALRVWTENRGTKAGPLFTNLSHDPNVSGGRITQSGIFRLVQKLGQAVGIPVNPGALRHTNLSPLERRRRMAAEQRG